jgi:hypothetical protein
MARLTWGSILLGSALLWVACNPELTVYKVSGNERTMREGIFYYLPRTVIIADVVVQKTTHYPGPFHEYAERYLGYSGISKKNSSYEIQSIRLNAVTEPDPEQVYLISMGKANSVLFEFEDNGVLRNVNILATEEERKESREARSDIRKELTEREELMQWINLREKLDTIYKREIYDDSVVVERWQIEKVLIQRTPEESAREAATRITQIRNNKFELIRFNEDVQYPDGTLKTMLAELDKMEAELFKLFLGYTQTDEIAYRFRYVPRSSDQGFQPLFKFSPQKGINDSLKMVMETVYIVPEAIGLTKSAKQMRGGQYQTPDKDAPNSQGLAYRQPELVNFNIIWNNKVLTNEVLPVAQMGFVQRLPLSRYTGMRISFDPSSGAIRVIGGNTTK